jgi:hypothetical protein
MFRSLKNLWTRALRRRRENPRLVITEEGVALAADGCELWRFNWRDVTRVETYKRDLFTFDMICLDFVVAAQRLRYPTHDEMQCFDDLCGCLRDHFPTIAESWWREVAFPAFETNHKVLYEKART